jgi:hypothetical protein
MFLILAISLLLLLPHVVLGGTTEKHKRWFSVRPLDKGKSKGQFGPWPLVCESQSVRYCFADARSQKNLENTVNEAVARWAHATLHSSLQIIPDNEESLLCSGPDIRPDALVIFDATKDNDKAWSRGPDCPTDSATTGYKYGTDERGRHRLDFCHLDPQDVKGTSAKAVVGMMHELGHAIGLQHEHQRDDRHLYLNYKCEVLFGYKEAQHLVVIDEKALFPDDYDNEKRMLLACNDDDIASDYLPAAQPFVKGMDHRLETELFKWKYYKFSAPFDYDSIMIYNSYSNVLDSLDVSKPENWVISRKDNGKPIWQGGSEDPAQAKITEGDIARVAQLYPSGDVAGDEAGMWDKWGNSKWKGPKLKVKVRGLETIVEAPRPLQSVDEVSAT